MKKTKLLMLSTIAPISLVLPVVVTSCNNNEGKFICEDSSQETVRGEVACWYIFDYQGSEEIPSDDIEVRLITETTKLNPQLLCQIVETKKIKVGVQGIRSQLATDGEEVPFTLEFKSEKLGIEGQTIDLKYKYLESKVRTISPKVEEREKDQGFDVDAEFVTTNPMDAKNLTVQYKNVKKSDESKISDPTLGASSIGVDGHLHQKIVVTKVGDWNDGDWIQFDLLFINKDEANYWEQTITGFTYQVLDIPYVSGELTKKCDIQIDIKGNTEKGLKVVNDGGEEGILPKGTKKNSPFAITFDKAKSPEEWPSSYVNFYKFGSFVDPTKYSGGYHHYSSVVVKLIKSDNSEQVLTQTYTGDRAGDDGDWWISTGGPITVIKKKLDKIDTNWKGLIFELRLAQDIENNSSFYITYSDK